MSNLKLRNTTYEEMLNRRTDYFLIGPNTRCLKGSNEEIGPYYIVTYYTTEIAVLFKNCAIFHYGGWHTSTTKNRLNQLMSPYGVRCYTIKYSMYFNVNGLDNPWFPFTSIAFAVDGEKNPVFSKLMYTNLNAPPSTILYKL